MIDPPLPPQGGRSQRVHEKIVARIGEMIAAGELRTGDRLPPERRLAETFRVSRHAVREALRALEEKGLVRSHVGDGTYVLDREEQSLVEPLAQAIGLGVAKLREIFEFRKLLEPQVAALAATAATTEELTRLGELLGKQRAAVTSEERTAADQAFHLGLARATGNSVLVAVFGQLAELLGESRSDSLQSRPRQLVSLQNHERILRALWQGDAQEAAREMLNHLQEIERAIFGH
jgi:GntR family transcriptional repressor for pyruvate dehydrogenase complex